MTSVLKIEAATTAAAGSVAMDIPADGVVTGMVASSSGAPIEVSLSSTTTAGVNDTRTSLIGLSAGGTIVSVSDVNIDLAGGDRVFLHWGATAGAGIAKCHIYFRTSGGRRRVRL